MQVWQENLRQINQWLEQPAGQRLLELERKVLQEHLASFESISSKECLLIYNGQHYHHLNFGYQQIIKIAEYYDSHVDVVAEPFALPFSENSVDVFILPYVLECGFPIQQVISECYRVLKPEGLLMVSGLNSHGILQWQLQRTPEFAKLTILSVNTLKKMLFLQGFDLVKQKKFSFSSLQLKSTLVEKLGSYVWHGLANGFVLSMQKRVELLTPLSTKIRWTAEPLAIKNTRLASVTTERKSIG